MIFAVCSVTLLPFSLFAIFRQYTLFTLFLAFFAFFPFFLFRRVAGLILALPIPHCVPRRVFFAGAVAGLFLPVRASFRGYCSKLSRAVSSGVSGPVCVLGSAGLFPGAC